MDQANIKPVLRNCTGCGNPTDIDLMQNCPTCGAIFCSKCMSASKDCKNCAWEKSQGIQEG